MKKILAMILAILMLVAMLPVSSFAASVEYTPHDDYYKVISKRDYELSPGISESEIVLNNVEGTHRQIAHVVEVDIDNPYTKVIPSIKGMVPTAGNYGTQTMDKQVAFAEANGYGNVVAAMNLSLSWYDSAYYKSHPELVGEPLGYMILDGVQYTNSQGNTSGAQTCLVINFDEKDGVARPTDIPKTEIRSTSSAITGWEEQVIPANFGFLLKDGVNQYSKDNKAANGAPRSFVGIKANGDIVAVMNDGRQAPYSTGFTNYEMAEFMLSLGCVYAINGDGGGSSQFFSQRPGEELELHCSPSDGGLRPTTHGILFISTAPATGEFVRATVTTEHDYYTPLSSVQFNAVGTDLVGTTADIPEDAFWRVTEGMGTIDENGLFVSTGATGVATAELVYEGKVVGSASINVVIPEEIAFNQNVITVPNGETTKLVINAKYGVHSVVTKPEDFDIVLSDGTVGTLNGFEFTAASDTAITGGSITVTFVHDTSKVAGATLRFGRASEVLFDFEDASDFADTWKTTDWKTGAINNSGGYYAKYGVHAVNKMNGKVHDGNGAMAMVNDFSYNNSVTWNSFYVNYYGEPIKIENAQAIGCWVYVPNDTPYIEFYLRVTNDAGKNVGKTLIYGDPDTPAKTGWQYISFDISQYKYITFNPGDRFIQVYYGGIQGLESLIDDPELNYKSTYYIDTVMIDYSTAVADREAPVFSAPQIIDSVSEAISEVNGQTVTSSINTFEVAVADFVKDNAVGINATSAKAYIDGNSMPCKYVNGKIILVDASMADGTHTITFTIEDLNGNLAEISRKIKVAANSNTPTASVVPHDATLDRILIGSLYNLDVNVTNVELTDKVELTINLNNLSQWELDHMTVAKGFEATYVIDETDPMDQIATITITRVGESDIVGAGTVASLPVRTWEWKQDEAPTVGGEYYTPEEAWSGKHTYYTVVKAYDIEGTLTLTDSTKVPFGADDIQVDTELWGNSSTGAPNTEIFNGKDGIHVHTAVPMDDVAATCTENGYTDRTYCEVCNSVVDWGETAHLTGHSFEVVGSKLACKCGETILQTGLVNIDGNIYYMINGNLYSGWMYIDTGYYYFHKSSYKAIVGESVIDGHKYTFDETGLQIKGSWDIRDGEKVYYWGGQRVVKQFFEIEGNTYYFDKYGYALHGYQAIEIAISSPLSYFYFNEDTCILEKTFDNGIHEFDGKLMYFKDGHANYAGLIEINGDYYYVNSGCEVITNRNYYVTKNNGLMKSNYYDFDSDGKMIIRTPKNGIVEEDGNLYYYIDGVKQYNLGMIEIEGSYYYVRSAGQLAVGNYFVYTGNGIVEDYSYQNFAKDGKLILQTKLDGIVEEDGNLYYYIDGVKQYNLGMIEIEGSYYYVRSAGQLAVGDYVVHNGNGIVPNYSTQKFDTNGKLVMQTKLDGIVEEDGNLYYYIDGAKQYNLGMIEIEGSYYYVRSAGQLAVGNYFVYTGNGIVEDYSYQNFAEDGKLILD